VPKGVEGDVVKLGSLDGVVVDGLDVAGVEHSAATLRPRLTRAVYEASFIGTSRRRPLFVISSRITPRLRSTRSQVSPISSPSRRPVFSARITAARSSLFLDLAAAPRSRVISS
jgi:hypothetical protein